ncbi:MAG: hypothetical protein JO041_16415 [Acidobacteria bacterium]|nr:hypothetical protein [Acidobacteriota bacterium]
MRFAVPQGWYRAERWALIAGVAGAVGCILGAMFCGAADFLRWYLVAYMFWLGISLGSLAIVCLIHVTTAQWGFAVRRMLESAARNISLLTLLFIPILLGMTRLYPWAHPAPHDFVTEHQRPYLNPTMWVLRAILYFIAWNVAAWALSRWSWLQDSPPDRAFRRRFQNFAGAALGVYAWTMTFASVDWMMSLDNHWRSTVYGFYVMAGQGLIAFSFLIIVAVLLWKYRPISEFMSVTHLHDIGKLMFAFLILWAYMAFSQGLIYWMANVKSEITWYINRTTGGWWWIGMVIILLHFFVPFFLLLSQGIKRDAGKLIVLAGWMLLMRFIDLYWLIIPNFPDTKGHLVFSWMVIAAMAGIGGVWVYSFLVNLKAHPLIPRHDPMIYQVLEAQEHGH